MTPQNHPHILNTSPTRYIIAGLLIILIFFGGLTAWSMYFPFQGAVIASGVVKVEGERKVVQHLEGGIIDRIHVREGERVAEGQVLIELKGSQIQATVDLLEGRLWAKQAEASRLRAEAGLKTEIVWLPAFQELQGSRAVSEIMALETDIFNSRRAYIQGQRELYLSQIRQLEKRIGGAREELQSQTRIVANLEEDLTSRRPLVSEKYLGRTNILELERSLFEHQGRMGRLNQDIAQFQQMIQEYQLRIADIQNQYTDQAIARLGVVTDEIFETQEQLKPNLDRLQRLDVRAPTSGIVINMRVHSEGSGVIQSGMPLLEIVPEDLQLVITVHVQPQDIVSVKPGQNTRVQLAAFERRSTPPVQGHVVHVSPDLISQQTPYGTISYYEARIAVDPEDLAAKNAWLSPGMPVVCYITTDERTVISYLLGPLLQGLDSAMRE